MGRGRARGKLIEVWGADDVHSYVCDLADPKQVREVIEKIKNEVRSFRWLQSSPSSPHLLIKNWINRSDILRF